MNIFEVGRRIKAIRKAQHLTQEQLAEKADISSHYLYEIERGNKNMSIYTLTGIAEALNVSLDYLVYGHVYDINNMPVDYMEKDELDLLIEAIPARKRLAVRDMLNVLLPYLR